MPSSTAKPAGVHWTSPELQDGVKAIALQRVVAVPLLALVGLLQPHVHALSFGVLAVVALIVEAWQLRQVGSDDWTAFPLPVLLFVDIGMVGLAVALTGGVHSPLAYIGLLTIFTGTFAFPPRYIAWLCAWTFVSVGGVVVVDGLPQDEGTAVVAYLFAVLFMTIVAINAARVREATSRSLRELAAARRRLVAETAQADALDRRRISHQLHDHGLQSLLSARQDLDEVAAGDPQALQFARDALQAGVTAVRDLIYDIDPAALSGTRLPEAVQALVERTGRPDGVAIVSTIAPDASGEHDDLLHAVARELLRRALVQPGVSAISIDLQRKRDVVQLTVADDGRQFAFDDDHAEGGVGVASAAARVDSAGGTLQIRTLREGGTTIVVRLADPLGTP